ncbi:MAG: MmcQ/YjbR family DNA-binding protein [Lysobacteraceae bacterium]|nr:MAG: MmcQ/YjbR family DNA-binding protein [Xanthomonadaceae bacterium]
MMTLRHKKGITYDIFVKMALAIPGVGESTSYGTCALKVKGKLMARLKEDGQSVVLRTSWEAREQRLALYPEVFYLTGHYRSHPWILMRLNTASSSLAKPAIIHAWQQCAS